MWCFFGHPNFLNAFTIPSFTHLHSGNPKVFMNFTIIFNYVRVPTWLFNSLQSNCKAALKVTIKICERKSLIDLTSYLCKSGCISCKYFKRISGRLIWKHNNFFTTLGIIDLTADNFDHFFDDLIQHFDFDDFLDSVLQGDYKWMTPLS